MGMKLNCISERAVKIVISLADARFSAVDFASADTEFGADFGLLHAVQIAIKVFFPLQ